MSFPNIPDITPEIDITFEEAVNLLLASIAMEEVSLSKLMDAETNKILCVINDCKQQDSVLENAIEINKSVDSMIKNMIKFQMLLQFKLDNVKEIIPVTCSTTTTSTSTSTTTTHTKTTTHTTTCTTTTRSTTTRRECCCSLTGLGKGCITHQNDEFCGNTAVLYAFAFSSDAKNRTIRYSVENMDTKLRLYVSGANITMQCPSLCFNKLLIEGSGRVTKHLPCEPDISDEAKFILTVLERENCILEFRMKIISDCPELNHDSGFVLVKNSSSNLRLSLC